MKNTITCLILCLILNPFSTAIAETISGTVLDGGTPIEGVLIDAGKMGKRISNAQGEYVFEEVPLGSSYLITAHKPSYRFTVQEYTGVVGENLVLDFNLETIGNIDTDQDNDGINDTQEKTDGTDALDTGSSLQILDTQICSTWNGFLDMYNFMEHINIGEKTINLQTRLYSIFGEPEGSFNISLTPGTEFDVGVHDMSGFTKDSYGKVCTVHDGFPGDIQGRMTYYRPLEDRLEFAFAVPFIKGKKANQYIQYNTFQPSLHPQESKDLVANWIQVTNLDSVVRTGKVRFYDNLGNLLYSINVSLQPEARRDISGHAYGKNMFGLVQWEPDVEEN